MSDKNCTLSQESLERLFCNLDELVEFQRRFLIDMEALLYGPVESRLLGKHFVDSVIYLLILFKPLSLIFSCRKWN
jgi:hypothetical protein